MPKHPPKYNLLLDENVETPDFFPEVNNYHNVKHLVKDCKMQGLKDPEVFKYAKESKRLLITYNFKDFTSFPTSPDTGVLGLTQNLTPAQIDKKLMTLLRKKKVHELYGEVYIITGETKI